MVGAKTGRSGEARIAVLGQGALANLEILQAFSGGRAVPTRPAFGEDSHGSIDWSAGGCRFQVEAAINGHHRGPRFLLLERCHGLVLVASARPEHEPRNLALLDSVRIMLRGLGRRLDELPLVFAWRLAQPGDPLPDDGRPELLELPPDTPIAHDFHDLPGLLGSRLQAAQRRGVAAPGPVREEWFQRRDLWRALDRQDRAVQHAVLACVAARFPQRTSWSPERQSILDAMGSSVPELRAWIREHYKVEATDPLLGLAREVLAFGDLAERRAAVAQLRGSLDSLDRTGPLWLLALEDDAADIRESAIRAFVRAGDAGRPYLDRALSNDRAEVVLAALEEIDRGRLARRFQARLVELARSTVPELKAAARRALRGRTGLLSALSPV